MSVGLRGSGSGTSLLSLDPLKPPLSHDPFVLNVALGRAMLAEVDVSTVYSSNRSTYSSNRSTAGPMEAVLERRVTSLFEACEGSWADSSVIYGGIDDARP